VSLDKLEDRREGDEKEKGKSKTKKERIKETRKQRSKAEISKEPQRINEAGHKNIKEENTRKLIQKHSNKNLKALVATTVVCSANW
jgi:hypothetical protein